MICSRSVALVFCISSCFIQPQQSSQPHILWGVSERQGKRPSMEDTYVAVSKGTYYEFVGLPHSWVSANIPHEYSLFGIFDGHAGSGAAHLAAHHIAKFATQPRLREDQELWSWSPFLKRIFAQTNQIILKSTSSGTTAVIGYIEHLKDSDSLYIAWVGDSRAVLGRPDATLLYETKDHKPNDPDEKKLIENRPGCFVVQGRANGILGVSRALGDRDIAACITAEPEVVSVILEPKYHKFMILACDGIWDVLPSQDALTLVAHTIKEYDPSSQPITERTITQEKTTERGNTIMVHAARTLIDAAYKKGSSDNLSAMVILFDWDNSYVAHNTTVIPKNFVDRAVQRWSGFWHNVRKSIGM